MSVTIEKLSAIEIQKDGSVRIKAYYSNDGEAIQKMFAVFVGKWYNATDTWSGSKAANGTTVNIAKGDGSVTLDLKLMGFEEGYYDVGVAFCDGYNTDFSRNGEIAYGVAENVIKVIPPGVGKVTFLSLDLSRI